MEQIQKLKAEKEKLNQSKEFLNQTKQDSIRQLTTAKSASNFYTQSYDMKDKRKNDIIKTSPSQQDPDSEYEYYEEEEEIPYNELP